MASIYQLSEALAVSPRANVIEWYVLPEAGDDNDADDYNEPLWINFAFTEPQFPSIRFRHPVALEEYRHKELVYSYDRSNDGQRTMYREALSESWNARGDLYRLVFQEDILPSHRFPCSALTVKNDAFVRRSFKINNRLCLIEEVLETGAETKPKEKAHVPRFQYYLRYTHAANVDVVKMQADLDQFIGRYKF